MLTDEAPVVLVVGTRPEGIKMAPVYYALKRAGIPTIVCSTMQHNTLLREVLDLFGIKPDIELNIMRPGQDLFYLTQSVLQKTKEVFLKINPALVLVQGDTTSSMAAALAAFYLGIPIGHVEAGLRTDDIQSPFPEEMNRRLITVIATYHFAPTPAAVANVLAHGVRCEQVFCTGNTVVDALQIIKEKIFTGELVIQDAIKSQIYACKQAGQEIAVLTVHRRESFNGALTTILQAVKRYACARDDLFWFYPYHPNPHVIKAIHDVGLVDLPNIYLCEPLAYKDMIHLLDAASCVLTDSGGIQEEAVSLGKPVLVLREKTERMEGVLAGCARVIGADQEKIKEGIAWAQDYHKRARSYLGHIYGDGHAAEKIVAFVQSWYEQVKQSAQEKITHNREYRETNKKENEVKKVCVIGLGYIGLPTAIVAAEHGYEVIGYDIDPERVHEINKGNPIITEPEVYEKLAVVLGPELFRASTKIEGADYFIVAVPTPITEDKKADLSCVLDAVDAIAPVLSRGNTVLIESTVPVGVTQHIAQVLEEKTGLQAGTDFYIAHCPERVLPGNIFHELVNNDRIIGGINQESAEQAQQFYQAFVNGQMHLTNTQAAEMVKLIENSSRDVELAFAHQVASMAYAIGLNPYEVIELANKHPRVNILRPTCGVGGHCLAVDPWFLTESFPHQTQLIKAAREVNDNKPREIIQCIEHAVNEWNKHNTRSCTVALLGATYKPDVDDVRESPALEIIRHFINQKGIPLQVCDPYIAADQIKQLGIAEVVSATHAITRADVVVFLVAHKRFKLLNRTMFAGKQVYDFCGVLHQEVKDNKSDQALFWPARSVMDFFIVNQANDGTDSDTEQAKGDT